MLYTEKTLKASTKMDKSYINIFLFMKTSTWIWERGQWSSQVHSLFLQPTHTETTQLNGWTRLYFTEQATVQHFLSGRRPVTDRSFFLQLPDPDNERTLYLGSAVWAQSSFCNCVPLGESLARQRFGQILLIWPTVEWASSPPPCKHFTGLVVVQWRCSCTLKISHPQV